MNRTLVSCTADPSSPRPRPPFSSSCCRPAPLNCGPCPRHQTAQVRRAPVFELSADSCLRCRSLPPVAGRVPDAQQHRNVPSPGLLERLGGPLPPVDGIASMLLEVWRRRTSKTIHTTTLLMPDNGAAAEATAAASECQRHPRLVPTWDGPRPLSWTLEVVHHSVKWEVHDGFKAEEVRSGIQGRGRRACSELRPARG